MYIMDHNNYIKRTKWIQYHTGFLDLSFEEKMRQNNFLYILCIMFILFSGIMIGIYLAIHQMTNRRLFFNQNNIYKLHKHI